MTYLIYRIIKLCTHYRDYRLLRHIIWSNCTSFDLVGYSWNIPRRMKTFSCCVPSSMSTSPSSSITTCRYSTESPLICSPESSFRNRTTISWTRRCGKTARKWTCSAQTSSWRRSNRSTRWWSFDTASWLLASHSEGRLRRTVSSEQPWETYMKR